MHSKGIDLSQQAQSEVPGPASHGLQPLHSGVGESLSILGKEACHPLQQSSPLRHFPSLSDPLLPPGHPPAVPEQLPPVLPSAGGRCELRRDAVEPRRRRVLPDT